MVLFPESVYPLLLFYSDGLSSMYITPNGETAVEMCHIEHVGWYLVAAFIMVRSKPRGSVP